MQAKEINQAAGGAIVAPWEIDELPMEWLDAAEALLSDTPRYAQGYAQVDEVKARWKAEHRKRYG